MHNFINVRPFMQHLFDDPITATKAAEIGQAILAARPLRSSEIAARMRAQQTCRLQTHPAVLETV